MFLVLLGAFTFDNSLSLARPPARSRSLVVEVVVVVVVAVVVQPAGGGQMKRSEEGMEQR